MLLYVLTILKQLQNLSETHRLFSQTIERYNSTKSIKIIDTEKTENHITDIDENKDDDNNNNNEDVLTTDDDPFGSVKRQITQKILTEMSNLAVRKGSLVLLEGWLEKKQSAPPYSWLKRWVVVKESHLLWNSKQIKINDVKNRKERKKWNNYVNLMNVTNVEIVKKSKTKRKLSVKVNVHGKNKKTREYIWRAKDEEDRDFWVNGLKEHIKFLKEMVSFLDE